MQMDHTENALNIEALLLSFRKIETSMKSNAAYSPTGNEVGTGNGIQIQRVESSSQYGSVTSLARYVISLEECLR